MIGRTGTANRTNYVPMSIMRIFWADALIPPLRDLYHALRAIPMSYRVYVGWDTPIEWLNGAITEGVTSLVSEQRIENLVENYSFMWITTIQRFWMVLILLALEMQVCVIWMAMLLG